MDVTLTKTMKIYRVICTDQYQSTRSETNWHTSKEYCDSYITNSPYRHCLSIESSELIIDN
jgi:hypothetical protein